VLRRRVLRRRLLLRHLQLLWRQALHAASCLLRPACCEALPAAARRRRSLRAAGICCWCDIPQDKSTVRAEFAFRQRKG
jgi:hypothetical protein